MDPPAPRPLHVCTRRHTRTPGHGPRRPRGRLCPTPRPSGSIWPRPRQSCQEPSRRARPEGLRCAPAAARGLGCPASRAGHLANVGLPANSWRRTWEQSGGSLWPCRAGGTRGHRHLLCCRQAGALSRAWHLLFTGCKGQAQDRTHRRPAGGGGGGGQGRVGSQWAEPHLHAAQLVPLGRAGAGSVPSIGDRRPPGGKTGALSRHREPPAAAPPCSCSPRPLGWPPCFPQFL